MSAKIAHFPSSESQPTPPVQTPTKIGRYRITEQIGVGGFGVVWKGADPNLDRHAAIKMMSVAGRRSGEELEQFRQEAKSAAALNHPNIVTIYELGQHQCVPYIAMEYLKGSDLRGVTSSGMQIAHDQIIHILMQIAEGLDFAHAAGVIHRDIKPSNVWFVDHGTVKILDFGLARMAGEFDPKEPIMGTIGYMAPEQLRKNGQLDGKADMFSLGIVGYELLTGQRPFAHATPVGVMRNILTETPAPIGLDGTSYDFLETIVMNCLEKDPSRRPSAREFVQHLWKQGGRWSGTFRAIPRRVNADAALDTTSVPGSTAGRELERLVEECGPLEMADDIFNTRRLESMPELEEARNIEVVGVAPPLPVVASQPRAVVDGASSELPANDDEAPAPRRAPRWRRAVAALVVAAGLAGATHERAPWRADVETALSDEVPQAAVLGSWNDARSLVVSALAGGKAWFEERMAKASGTTSRAKPAVAGATTGDQPGEAPVELSSDALIMSGATTEAPIRDPSEADD